MRRKSLYEIGEREKKKVEREGKDRKEIRERKKE